MKEFYKKEWFLWLCLILFAPVGIVLLWKYNKKNTIVKIFLSVASMILFLGVIASMPTTEEMNDTLGEAETSQKQNKDSDFQTEGEWALGDPYKFSVEIDSYDGDVYQSGEYEFTETTVNMEPEYTPYIYDIYASKESYDNMYDMFTDWDNRTPKDGVEILDMIGGYGNIDKPRSLKLETGYYIYVIPSEPIGKPTGILEIKKK